MGYFLNPIKMDFTHEKTIQIKLPNGGNLYLNLMNDKSLQARKQVLIDVTIEQGEIELYGFKNGVKRDNSVKVSLASLRIFLSQKGGE